MSAGLAVLHPVIGILGGMGPAATADFYSKIVRATPALRDQDHPQALIWSDPSIPDRTSALAGDGPHPGPQLADGARRLERGGAGLIAVPCNTAHAFLAEIQAAVDIPVLNMIEETRDRVIEDGLVPARKIARLAARGTVRARLYQHAFARSGVEVVVPDVALQERVAEAIACVKSDASDARAGELLASVVAAFFADGIDAVILRCHRMRILDASGADAIKAVSRQFKARGVRFVVQGMTESQQRTCRLMHVFDEDQHVRELSEAVAWVDRALAGPDSGNSAPDSPRQGPAR